MPDSETNSSPPIDSKPPKLIILDAKPFLAELRNKGYTDHRQLKEIGVQVVEQFIDSNDLYHPRRPRFDPSLVTKRELTPASKEELSSLMTGFFSEMREQLLQLGIHDVLRHDKEFSYYLEDLRRDKFILKHF